MKYIFLDIDGVLATDDCYFKKKFKIDKGKVDMPYPWDLLAIESLNNIIKKTECKIVISSDWRKHWITPDLKKMFDHYGLPPDLIVGTTGDLKKFSEGYESARTREIYQYVGDNLTANDEWVAVDDMYLQFENPDRFIRIEDTGIGIVSKEEEIISKLNK